MKWFVIGILFVPIVGAGVFAMLGKQSQTGQAKGLIEGKLAPCGSRPNCVCSEHKTAPDAQIAPLQAPNQTTKHIASRIIAVVQSMGGELHRQEGNYLAFRFQSRVFGFVDDLELRIDPRTERNLGSSFIHVRSASRVGYSDRGVNRKRVERLRALWGKT